MRNNGFCDGCKNAWWYCRIFWRGDVKRKNNTNRPHARNQKPWWPEQTTRRNPTNAYLLVLRSHFQFQRNIFHSFLRLKHALHRQWNQMMAAKNSAFEWEKKDEYYREENAEHKDKNENNRRLTNDIDLLHDKREITFHESKRSMHVPFNLKLAA